MSPVPTTAIVMPALPIGHSPAKDGRRIPAIIGAATGAATHLSEHRMPVSRRSLVGAGVGLAAAGLLKPFGSRAAEPRFATDPFTLGVASGFPEPNAVVLWTRLAPEPFAPGGGMPSAPVEVRWEIAGDEGFKQIERNGTAYATPEFAHSVHVEAAGLSPG